MSEVTKYDDTIDSREIIARIEKLQQQWSDSTGNEFSDYALSSDDLLVGLSADDAAELSTLTELAAQGADYAADWQYGETLIRDSYFTEYAQQLAEDIGAIDSNAGWPMRCIDWEQAARELQIDYTSIDFDGITYWIR